MKWGELTDEQKLAYKAAYRAARETLDDGFRTMRHFLTGLHEVVCDDKKVGGAAYRLDFQLWELSVAVKELDEVLGQEG
jgi:hypothetical protein